MQRARPGHNIRSIAVRWKQTWRIIATRYPPIDLFERVSNDPAVWEVLIELEQATNPRVRDQVGELTLVPAQRRVSGPNASWVMAPLTHPNPKGSRFSNGTFGVYYCANRLETAIAETAYHFGRFARDSGDPSRREDMRVLLGSVSARFHNADALPKTERAQILDPNSYAASRAFAAALRDAGSNGITYPSVRDDRGRCVAAFWPDTIGIPIQERHLQYEWDGTSVSRFYDYKTATWQRLDEIP